MDIDKIKGALGVATIEEMDVMNEQELKTVVVEANTSMKQVDKELKENAQYQEAKENVKAMSQGKKEVDKRQKARIAYSLTRLEELGKMAFPDRREWEKRRLAALEKAAAKAAAEITKELKASGISVSASLEAAK
jgi:hypothetical protein